MNVFGFGLDQNSAGDGFRSAQSLDGLHRSVHRPWWAMPVVAWRRCICAMGETRPGTGVGSRFGGERRSCCSPKLDGVVMTQNPWTYAHGRCSAALWTCAAPGVNPSDQRFVDVMVDAPDFHWPTSPLAPPASTVDPEGTTNPYRRRKLPEPIAPPGHRSPERTAPSGVVGRLKRRVGPECRSFGGLGGVSVCVAAG